jgi:hypothetical protein
MPPVTPITPAIQAPVPNTSALTALRPGATPLGAIPLGAAPLGAIPLGTTSHGASQPGTSKAGTSQPGTSKADQGDRRLRETAHQFESMFMTEMLRHARPDPKTTGRFAGGAGEGAWRVLMDQALGEAASTGGPAGDRGLGQAIVKSLRDAQHPHRSTR